MSATTEIDPNSYEAITSFWQFDRNFYEDIGLDLSALESPAEDGVIPALRRAASLVVRAQATDVVSSDQLERAGAVLIDRHRKTHEAIAVAQRGVRYKDVINTDHPAVIAWQERNEQAKIPDRRPVSALIGRIRLFEIGLIRPRMDEDPEYIRAPFKPITLPNANYYDSLIDVANQLALARVGIWFDI